MRNWLANSGSAITHLRRKSSKKRSIEGVSAAARGAAATRASHSRRFIGTFYKDQVSSARKRRAPERSKQKPDACRVLNPALLSFQQNLKKMADRLSGFPGHSAPFGRALDCPTSRFPSPTPAA